MKNLTHLLFGAVWPAGEKLAGWAFVAREDVHPTKGRFLHSGSGVVEQTNGLVAQLYALGYGLSWLKTTGNTKRSLLVGGRSESALGLLAGQMACPTPQVTALCTRCQDLLRAFEEVQFSRVEELDEPDTLARFAWESATGKPYPQRPTRFQRRSAQRPARA